MWQAIWHQIDIAALIAVAASVLEMRADSHFALHHCCKRGLTQSPPDPDQPRGLQIAHNLARLSLPYLHIMSFVTGTIVVFSFQLRYLISIHTSTICRFS